MSIATLRTSVPASCRSRPTDHPDGEFERRWTARRQPALIAAVVTPAIVVSALLAYGLSSS